MGGAELPAAAADGADHQRHFDLAVEHVVELGDVIDDRVHGQEGEVDRHQLGHGAQARDGRAGRGAGDDTFGDGRILHALLAELIEEAAGDSVGAAPLTDLLAHNEHPLVAVHLFSKGLADGLTN